MGSHAWGEFSRRLAALYPERMERLRSQSWSQRAAWVTRAVVVRHPLDRLVSAYRMIFQVNREFMVTILKEMSKSSRLIFSLTTDYSTHFRTGVIRTSSSGGSGPCAVSRV